MRFGDTYIQIGRLELFYTRYWSFSYFSRKRNSCRCIIVNLGFVGFAILSMECARDL